MYNTCSSSGSLTRYVAGCGAIWKGAAVVFEYCQIRKLSLKISPSLCRAIMRLGSVRYKYADSTSGQDAVLHRIRSGEGQRNPFHCLN